MLRGISVRRPPRGLGRCERPGPGAMIKGHAGRGDLAACQSSNPTAPLTLATGRHWPPARRSEHPVRCCASRHSCLVAAAQIRSDIARRATRRAVTICSESPVPSQVSGEHIQADRSLWVPIILSPHATWSYSRISPPSRSRRRTRRLCPDRVDADARQAALL